MYVLSRLVLTMAVIAIAMSSWAEASQRLSAAGVYDFRGKTLDCTAVESPTLLRGLAQRVGLHLTGDDLTVRRAVIQNCEIGVRVDGQRVRIEQIRPQAISMGFWLSGCGGYVEENIVIGAGIGFYLPGCSYTLLNNHASENSHAGYFITGNGNTLEGNEALNNGQAGIYLGASTGVVRETQPVMDLRMKAMGNTMTGNTALGHGIDIAENPIQFSCDENFWQDNTFQTSQLPEPCPPEEEETRGR